MSYVAPITTYVETPVTTYVQTPVTTTVELPIHPTTVTETAPRVGRTSYTTNLYSGGSYVAGATTTGAYTVAGSGLASSYTTGVYPGNTYVSTTVPQVYAPATSVYDNYNLGYRSYNTGSSLGSYGIGYTSALPATATIGGYGRPSYTTSYY